MNNPNHRPPLAPLTLSLSLKHLGGWLAVAIGFLTLAGAGIVAAKFTYGFNGMYHLYSLFDLDGDSSVPTWYASFSLLICSLLLVFHARISRESGCADVWKWSALAAIFLVMSVDETARIHEILGGYVGVHVKAWAGEGDGDGFLHFSWVIPGGIFVGVMARAYIRFLLALPRDIAWRMVLSAAVYVGGALFMEMVDARSEDFYGAHGVYYQVGTVFEEFLEMAGVALFADTLTRYLGRRTARIALTLAIARAGNAAAPAPEHPRAGVYARSAAPTRTKA